MIRLLEEFTPWDVYSARVLAAYRSYFDMKECQFWAQCPDNSNGTQALTAVVSLVDGFAILSVNETADWEELAAFLRMQPWSRLQCGTDTAANLPFPVEWRSMMLRWAAPLVPDPFPLTPVADPGEVYDILSRCFPDMKNRADWMADLALRWRRGTAKSWVIEGQCTASAMAITEKHAFVGALGTLSEARGRGLAGKLLTQIAGEMAGREVWLSCREELQGFYESIGFERAGDMITLNKEGQA